MTTAQPKEFNTAGPCVPSKHYMLPALPRLPAVKRLLDRGKYFALRSPLLSGKTTSIMAAVDSVNEEGSYCAMYCSLADVEKVADKVEAMGTLIGALNEALGGSKVDALKRAFSGGLMDAAAAKAGYDSFPVRVWLRTLSERLDKDLVIFFDEADSLQERPLASFLSQLRNGHAQRETIPFPRSIALVGMLDIRERKAEIGPGSETPRSGAPFNIITSNLTMPNFTRGEIGSLYARHTEATGQAFEDEAVRRAWYWSEGQPWVVNALAREAVETLLDRDYGTAITARHIDDSVYLLMGSRAAHVNSLLARLREPRVRRFIEPMLAPTGKSIPDGRAAEAARASYDDDLRFCLGLGIIKRSDGPRPANPFYASVMTRHLDEAAQEEPPR